VSYIRSDDAALYYEEYGGGETLILLPGLWGTIDLDWRRFIPDVARHFHTVAVDLRGHGKTDNPSGALQPSQLLADVATLYETLEIDRAFLCTHGIMAFLPLMFALQSPAKVGGIMLHAPRGVIGRAEGTHDDTALSIPYTEPELRHAHAPGSGPDGWRRLVLQSAALSSGVPLGRTELRALRVPVLVTCGDRDTPGEAAELSRELPAARLSVLPKTGHRIASVQKPSFLAALLAFAQQVSTTER